MLPSLSRILDTNRIACLQDAAIEFLDIEDIGSNVAGGEHPVIAIHRVTTGPGAIIGMTGEDDVAQRVIEEKLRDQELGLAQQDAHMDMHGAARIPSGIDAEEAHYPILVADLPTAQERSRLGRR